MVSKKFYTYISYYRGIPVYVGKGSGKRWKHTFSGASGSELLNEFYFRQKFFNDMPLETYVLRAYKDNLTATKAEKVLISKYLPLCNKCTGRSHSVDQCGKMKSKLRNLLVRNLLMSLVIPTS